MEISYSPPGPVCAEYIQDRSFVSLIAGPVGSGKTVGSLMKGVSVSLQQSPFERVRHSRGMILRNCFDDKTEILTERRGWLLFSDLSEDDRVAMLQDGQLVFVLPTYYYAAPYKGEMVGYRSEGVDFLVTPDHRMYVSQATTRKKTWGDYHFKLAKDIEGRSDYRLKRDAEWVGQDVGFSVEFFEWLGLWFAEGSVGSDEIGRRRLFLTQKKPEGIEHARNLFLKAGVPFIEQPRGDGGINFKVPTSRWHHGLGNRLFDALRGVGKATTKAVPWWVKQASPAHLGAFIGGFVAGDGWMVGNTRIACTSSKALADDLHEMALKAGLVANVNFRDRIGVRMCVNGVDTSPTAVEYTVTFLEYRGLHPKLYRGKWHRKDYDGMVYCVEVPTHVVYVRRHGRAMWCSQTYPELRSTVIKSFQEWFPEEVAPINWASPITAKLDIELPDKTRMKCEILFLALDRPEDVGKLKSLELTWAAGSELSEVPKAVFDMMTQRVGRFPPKRWGGADWYGVFGDTNMPDDDHWIYRIFEEDKPEGFKLFKQPGGLIERNGEYLPNMDAENIPNLPGGHGYYLRQIAGKDKNWIRVYACAQYGTISTGKPVYPEYNDDIHCRQIKPYQGLPLLIGMDYGLTPAAVICQQSPRGQFRVYADLVSENMGIRQFARDALKPFLAMHFPGYKVQIIGDPAGARRADTDEKTCFMVLGEEGFPAMPAISNEPTARKDAVKVYLTSMSDGQPNFALDPNARVVRKGMNGGYHYKRVQVTGDERYRDVPDKNEYSHPVEGMEYAALFTRTMKLAGDFGKKIEYPKVTGVV